nr:immunoglobulin light chain junction region [Macaca mulatta]
DYHCQSYDSNGYPVF